MSHLSLQQNQIRCEPEVCVNETGSLIPKKRNKSRFSSFARVLAVFSLISLAPTAISVDWNTLLGWTDQVASGTAQIIASGNLTYADVKRLVDAIFRTGNHSLTAGEIQNLKTHFRTRLIQAGVPASMADLAANWFESALDRFKQP